MRERDPLSLRSLRLSPLLALHLLRKDLRVERQALAAGVVPAGQGVTQGPRHDLLRRTKAARRHLLLHLFLWLRQTLPSSPRGHRVIQGPLHLRFTEAPNLAQWLLR